MNDTNCTSTDCVVDVSEDNPQVSLKEDEQIQKKYFNGGKVVMSKIHIGHKKKKTNIAKRPLRKWELRFLIITVFVIFMVLFFGYVFLAINEKK